MEASRVRNSSQGPDNAGVLIFPPLLLVAAMVFGFISSLFFPSYLLPKLYGYPLAACTVVAALGIERWAQHSLRIAQTAVHPAGVTSVIICDGAYAYSRNPIYLAQGLLLIAVGLLVRDLSFFVALLPWYWVMRQGVIAREERYLARKFGSDYARYRQHVRRWF
jgi:protein-S-isoprenylcysteine O-methyltransferase Ste14